MIQKIEKKVWDMRNSLRVMWLKIVRYLGLAAICFWGEKILESIGLIEIFDRDIKYVTMNGVLLALTGVIIFIIGMLMKNDISSTHIWLKKNRQYVMTILCIIEGLIFFKSKAGWQWGIGAFEFIIACVLIDYETSRTYKYSINSIQQVNSNFVEKPVVGRIHLTSNQCEALNQLEKLIDNRKSTDSFNIALIGAWGSGKTSITDTLISEYEDKKALHKYFILKISVMTLKETKNIVNYVKNFFEDLFKYYSIEITGKNVAFLTSLAKSFNASISIGDVLKNADENSFCDLEKEKDLFSSQVSKLLKISGRKNVLFILDDTDRSEEEEQIIKLLVEFSSINGIISIISLDKSRDIVKTVEQEEKTGGVVYNPIDKYIHIRIRINEDNHIEYDKNITRQIMTEYAGIKHKEKCYISFGAQSIKNTLFRKMVDIQTTEVVGHRFTSIGTYNLLTEIFFENLKCNAKEFGSYLEKLVDDYIYHSKELMPYVKQMLTIPLEHWEMKLFKINAQWINLVAMPNNIDWTIRLQNNSATLFFTLLDEIEALNSPKIAEEAIEYGIKDIEDVYDCWMLKQFPMEGRTLKNRKEHPVGYSGIDQVELVAFEQDEYDKLNFEIALGNFNVAKKILTLKAEKVANLFFSVKVLTEFIVYIRSRINNYRSFKMQLREAELQNVNYLDYLIKEWNSENKITESIAALKENKPILRELNIEVPSVQAIINNVLFENYILKYGERFMENESNIRRIFLWHGKEKKNIVISDGSGEANKMLILDISGNELQEISKKDVEEIKKRNYLIWNE